MSSRARVISDREVLELLADEPELLAIADAVAATQPRPSQRRRRSRLVALAAALLVVAAFVALLPLRGDGEPLLGEALAAIGGGPVVHARIEARLPQNDVVDLATGRAKPQTVSIEFWYDEPRGRLRTMLRRGGVVVEEFLETRTQAMSGSGPVRRIGEGGPSLSPALAGFVTRYRDALKSGDAEIAENGRLAGRDVTWLRLGSGATRQRVAVDAETRTPILIVPLDAQGRPATISWRVRTIGTVARVEANFAAPRPRAPRPFRGDVREARAVSSNELATAARRPALWLGQSWRGLRLVSIELQTLSRGYPPGSGKAAELRRGVSLRYGDGELGEALEISQAAAPEPAYAFAEGALTFNRNPIPRQGFVEIVQIPSASDRTRVIGQLRQQGVFVTIWASNRELCLAAARALRTISN